MMKKDLASLETNDLDISGSFTHGLKFKRGKGSLELRGFFITLTISVFLLIILTTVGFLRHYANYGIPEHLVSYTRIFRRSVSMEQKKGDVKKVNELNEVLREDFKFAESSDSKYSDNITLSRHITVKKGAQKQIKPVKPFISQHTPPDYRATTVRTNANNYSKDQKSTPMIQSKVPKIRDVSRFDKSEEMRHILTT